MTLLRLQDRTLQWVKKLFSFQNTIEKYQAAMHFYKEPGRDAIEQVLSRKGIGECEIRTPACNLIFKLESVRKFIKK